VTSGAISSPSVASHSPRPAQPRIDGIQIAVRFLLLDEIKITTLYQARAAVVSVYISLSREYSEAERESERAARRGVLEQQGK